MRRITSPDIRPPGEIDAAWLTAVLEAGGVEATVREFTATPVGTGQIGDSFRFSLDYVRGGDGAPASLVGKFPAAGEESRQAGVSLGNYAREVRFYQHLASTALVSTPRCYFTDVDETSGDFVLMMEDLAPAQQGDQLAGVTLDQARRVIVEAARLHASHWGDDSLEDLPWVSGTRASPPSPVTNEAIIAFWREFKDRYGSRLLPKWVKTGDWLSARYTELSQTRDGPRCLTHNDFRPDNMMFASASGGRPITVLDWQSIAYGLGATDVAYFLAGALAPEVRRSHEADLLTLYHDTLVSLGVRGYAMDDLKRQYARGAYQLFSTAFFAAMIVTQTERGDRMFLQMISSASDHLWDHGIVS